ncbi:MAG: hypothetical protein ACRC2B_15190, partial [Rubrivivax sp.]
PALLAGTVVGERRQNGVINSNDGKRAASSPDWLSGSDPKQKFAMLDSTPRSRHSAGLSACLHKVPTSRSGRLGRALAVQKKHHARDKTDSDEFDTRTRDTC